MLDWGSPADVTTVSTFGRSRESGGGPAVSNDERSTRGGSDARRLRIRLPVPAGVPPRLPSRLSGRGARSGGVRGAGAAARVLRGGGGPPGRLHPRPHRGRRRR